MEQSKHFYIRVTGDYALFTTPETKAGGESFSYPVPTKQALQGIVDAVYFKPTFQNVVDAVRICSPIRTHVRGNRGLILFDSRKKSDLFNKSYLVSVDYIIKFHFIWATHRDDLAKDRIMNKHTAIMERSIERGGRQSIFLGTRECTGFVEKSNVEDFNTAPSPYENQQFSYGLMFNEFIYPKNKRESFRACYAPINMDNGIIQYPTVDEAVVIREINDYGYTEPEKIKSVEEEYLEYFGGDVK